MSSQPTCKSHTSATHGDVPDNHRNAWPRLGGVWVCFAPLQPLGTISFCPFYSNSPFWWQPHGIHLPQHVVCISVRLIRHLHLQGCGITFKWLCRRLTCCNNKGPITAQRQLSEQATWRLLQRWWTKRYRLQNRGWRRASGLTGAE